MMFNHRGEQRILTDHHELLRLVVIAIPMFHGLKIVSPTVYICQYKPHVPLRNDELELLPTAPIGTSYD